MKRDDLREEIALYTPEQALTALKGQNGKRELAHLLRVERIHLSKLYMLPEGVIGVLLLPEQIAGNSHQILVPYYLMRERLILVAKKEEHKAIRELVRKAELADHDTPEVMFCRLLESMLVHDMECLQDIEVTCYAMEEWLIGEGRQEEKAGQPEPTTEILYYRKQILMRNFHYQQFADLCDTLAYNEHGFLGERALSLVADLEKRAERLHDYSQMLREYLVQIRELYQQQIDLAQNRTMQALTVVTTIFLPLTLIAGWYGMNFEYMPELHSPYGYWAVLGISMLIAVGEILYFRKKRYI